MRLFILVIPLLFLIPYFSKGQTMLDHLNEKGIEKGNKYAFVRIPDQVVPTLKNKDGEWPLFSEGGVIMIPKMIKETILDTITFELKYNSDSTICTNKNIHSVELREYAFITHSLPDTNCLKVDTTEGYKVYQIVYYNLETIPPINITKSFNGTCEDFGKKLINDVIIEEYTYHLQPELKWISLEKWNIKGKTKLDIGIMNNAYEDKDGNKYLVFEEGYYSDVIEVFCHVHKQGPTFIEIKQALKDRGYDVVISEWEIKKTKSALIQFQKDNNLPQGNLNIETLRALDLMY